MPSQHGQAYLTRSWRITRICGMMSSLLAGLHANLPQHGTVVRTDTLGFRGSSVAHHLARQGWVQRLAPALGPL